MMRTENPKKISKKILKKTEILRKNYEFNLIKNHDIILNNSVFLLDFRFLFFVHCVLVHRLEQRNEEQGPGQVHPPGGHGQAGGNHDLLRKMLI